MFSGSILISCVLLLSIVLFNGSSFASGHTVLVSPLSYNPIDCNLPECPGPVPPAWPSGPHKFRNSPENPAAFWKRGEKVRIRWHRNNHGGGFVRFSLVPLSKMPSRQWHAYTAFQYGCFESHRYRCPSRTFYVCGTDSDGEAYYQNVEVPKVFPDGKYVFTMVWYGGLKYDRKSPLYPNYYSASHVRIKGGQNAPWYRPKFAPVPSSYTGFQGEKVPNGYCLTTSTWVGECGGRACFGNKAVSTIPANFKKGKSPKPILASEIRKVL